MGFVKLKKSDSEFDLLPAQGILDMELTGNEIRVKYSSGISLDIFPSVAFENEDVHKIHDAALKIEGASGECIFPGELNTLIDYIGINFIT